MHMGSGHTLGERGGEQGHTLTISEIPTHTHTANANSGSANNSSPISNFSANAGKSSFNSAVNTPLAPQAIGNVGGGQAHLNMAPFLTLSFCIALQGIFPSQT